MSSARAVPTSTLARSRLWKNWLFIAVRRELDARHLGTSKTLAACSLDRDHGGIPGPCLIDDGLP